MSQGKGLIVAVLYVGVMLQMVLAGLLFLGFYYLSAAFMTDEKLRTGVSLLSGFMLATPLGFMLSNFIFRMIKPLREKLDEVSDYAGTQKLLFFCLLFSLFIVLLAFVFFYLLDR